MEKLGIIAGSGSLPKKLIKACIKQNRPFCIVALKDQFDNKDIPSDAKSITIRLGAGGKALAFLKEQGASELILAGGVKRPSLTSLRPDGWTAKQLKRFNLKKIGGDDSLLKTILHILEEEEGFKVVGAHEILPELVASSGMIGHIYPSLQSFEDTKKAFDIAKEIGRLDIGQACIVNEGRVVAVEALEGTDRMLERTACMKDQSHGGVLLKAAKPNQEMRVDMPSIGLKTLYNAQKAGLKGVALEAGAALILEPETIAAKADELGLFLMGVNEASFTDKSLVKKRIYLIAGEASGDKLGASLMENMQNLHGEQYQFIGIGGPLMAQYGLKSLFPMEELSLMGITAVIPKLPKLTKRINQTIEHILQIEPDMVITIDSPGFNKRVAKKIRAKNPKIPLTHWVAPSVWAWKPKRAKKMAQIFDNLLCLLPFEPPYFEKEGLKSYITGHPIVSLGANKGDGDAFKQKYHIEKYMKILSVLPGSRPSEVNRLLPIYKEAILKLKKEYKDLKLVIPLASAVASQVRQEVETWEVSTILIEDEAEKYDAFAASDAALAASGTVSLELAMAKVPMVIAYTMGKWTDKLARILIKVKYASLINILENQSLIPEFLGNDCTADNLYMQLSKFLSRQETPDYSAWNNALLKLGQGSNPGQKAAEIIHEIMNNNQEDIYDEVSISPHDD
ncbi:MAG: lipid-A-disaccharide synthase [Alphaproteobacteria bacterium]